MTMQEMKAQKFYETYVEMRRTQHAHTILLAEVYEMRSKPGSEPMAMTAQPRLEELRLEIEELQTALNFVADLELHAEQLAYERSEDAIARDEQDEITELRGGLF